MNTPEFDPNLKLKPLPLVKVGGLYRHFKGNVYKVINLAIHTEINETLVIYQKKDDTTIWARPISSFCSIVPGKNCLRFAPVAEEDG